MKRKLILLCLLIGCLALFAACASKDAGAEIKTAKSGRIDVTLYDPSPAAGKQDKDAQPTPTVETDDKGITDDGLGLYTVRLEKEGEGTVSVASTKVRAGTSVTVNAVPADEWKIEGYALDMVPTDSNTFVMPEHDVTFYTTFTSLRHQVFIADDSRSYLSFDGDTAVEGATCYFSVNGSLAADNYYYEEEELYVTYDAGGERHDLPLQKAGDDRFSFVMPAYSCTIGLVKHAYRSVTRFDVFRYTNYPEDDITAACALSLTCDGAPYEYGVKVHDDAVFRFEITPPFPCVIQALMQNYRYNEITCTKDGTAAYAWTFPAASIDVEAQMLLYIRQDANMHAVSVAEVDYGAVTADKAWAGENETVTVTATAGSAQLLLLQYTVNGTDYVEIVQSGGVYAFSMPAADVTVKATFRAPNTAACRLLVDIEGQTDYASPADVLTDLRCARNGGPLEAVPLTHDLTVYFDFGEYAQFNFWLDKNSYEVLGVAVNGSSRPMGVSNSYDVTFDVPENDFDVILRVRPL